MTNERPKPVVNLADVPLEEHSHGERFSARIGEVGMALGGSGVGCMYYEVPPGKRAFPFHNHHVQHELFVILEGNGKYRFGPDTFPVRAGDICVAPTGGPEVAHQLVNDSTGVLRYLGLSTSMGGAEVVEYPDSVKFGATVRTADGSRRIFRYRGRRDGAADYWDGED